MAALDQRLTRPRGSSPPLGPGRQRRGVVCEQCGRARHGELVLVGIAFDRHVTVERYLCRWPCAEKTLAAMGQALAP